MSPDPELLEASGERVSSRGSEPIGALIDGHYRLLRLLGAGGMAEVYEVEHVGLGRHFALKLLRADLARDRALVERFEREARAVAKLESAHIVGIVDAGVWHDAPYFVMERLHGEELRKLLTREGSLPVQRAVHLALDVCRALSVAHAAGVIHRDLKPENLFITRSELGIDHCKVLDFGVAKLAGENPTMPGALMGTARYMAPEQISHSTAVAPFTDVFSLGVILYECLAGEAPFAADTLERVLFRILNEKPRLLVELRPEIPSGLSALIDKALSKSGDGRPQSAAAFAEALASFTRAPGAGSDALLPGEHATLLQPDPLPAERLASGETEPSEMSSEVVQRGRGRALALAGLTFALGIAVGALWGRQRAGGPSEPSEPSGLAPTMSAASVAREVQPSPRVAPSSADARVPTGDSKAPPPRASAPRQPTTSASAAVGRATPSTPPLFFPAEPTSPK